MTTLRNPRMIEAESAAAEAVADVIEHCGFRRALGRLWTALYVSPEALSANDLAERLQMSSGAVSTTVAELRRWGVIKRVWRPGERRELWEAESDLWRVVSNVVREREGLLAATSRGRLEAALATAEEGADESDAPSVERLRSLVRFARTGEGLLARVAAMPPADLATLGRLVDAMQGLKRAASGMSRETKTKQESGGAA